MGLMSLMILTCFELLTRSRSSIVQSKGLRVRSQEELDSNPGQGNELPCDVKQAVETLSHFPYKIWIIISTSQAMLKMKLRHHS